METTTAKLLQIVLLGQPELIATLSEPRWEPLRQRIFCMRQLRPLDNEQTHRYIGHRLERAGAKKMDLFTDGAADLIYDHSGGIPRIVNQLADNALLGAFGASKTFVDQQTVAEVVAQMMSLRLPQSQLLSQQTAINACGSPPAESREMDNAGALQSSLIQLIQSGSEIAGRLTEANRMSASQADKLSDGVTQLESLLSRTDMAASRLTTARATEMLARHASEDDTKSLRSRLDHILTSSHQLDEPSNIGPQGAGRLKDTNLPCSRRSIPQPNRMARTVNRASNLRDDLRLRSERSSQSVCRNLERITRRQRTLTSAVAESVGRFNARLDTLMHRLEEVQAQSHEGEKGGSADELLVE